MDYCRYLEQKTGYTVRLPTEIEWEYAARGPGDQRYPWPDSTEFFGWAGKGANSPRAYDPVGKDITWRGASDMAGNVSEWCLDLYSGEFLKNLKNQTTKKPYCPGHILRPANPLSGTSGTRTYRGGSFRDINRFCEVSFRRSLEEDEASLSIGFRPVIVIKP